MPSGTLGGRAAEVSTDSRLKSGRADTWAVMLNQYAQYLWDAEFRQISLDTISKTETPTVKAMATWAAATLETVLARFEKDYGLILARTKKPLILGGEPPMSWEISRPPQSKEYILRLLEVQWDRHTKALSKLPPVPTGPHTDTDAWFTALEKLEGPRTLHEASSLETFWYRLSSLMARVDEWFEEREADPQEVKRGTKRCPDVDDDDDLEKRARRDSHMSSCDSMQLGDHDGL
jgi:hypothetical protein